MKESDKNGKLITKNSIGYLRGLSNEAFSVVIIVAFFVAASGWLFFQVNRELDPNNGKNWWTLAFETRDATSLSFAIENHSNSTKFTYAVSNGKETIDSGEISLAKGDRKTVLPNVSTIPGRAIVTVTALDGSKKEIYRER
jgi:hypothetical protein